MPKAVSLTEAIFAHFRTAVGLKHPVESFDLKPGKSGVFKVWLADELVYSKQETGRHPEPQEIIAMITPRL